ncbi:MAG: N-acetylmuramoyl-L-alanine amidase [Oscillospiraceae bacterium]|nr:N-acetylmuramoyl-L-alanine amidase [Oscillospiraceae bacterium]
MIFLMGFSAGAVSNSARSRIFYDDREALFITHPAENSRVTTSSRMSFLGDSDSRHKLYINGEEVKTTPNGFFTYYAELALGENQFLLVNGTNSEIITITREAAGDWTAPETTYYSTAIFGSVEADYIPRFAYFDDDLHGKTPLMSGTTFKIIGERGDYYLLADDTAVFKNHVYQLGRTINSLTVSGGEISFRNNKITVSFDVTDNPLYEITLNEHSAELILYADRDLSNLQTGASYVTEISKNVQFAPSAIIYDIEFARIPTGYIVRFADGKMNIDFRFAPTCLTETFVLLDAGHGGGDPGALGPPGEFGSMEKDFNLYVAQTAQSYLRTLGVEVLLIRDIDYFVQIMDRVEFFSLEPDVIISVHANSAPLSSDFSSLSGPLMFYTLDTSERAADSMITLINDSVSIFTQAAPEPRHRRQNFAMSRYTGGAAMLFEMGFMCNPTEYELMLNSTYLDRMGTALGMSVEQYIKDLMIAENPEVVHTFAPLPPPPIVIDIEDIHPTLAEAYNELDINETLNQYIILITVVILCGALMCLPSAFRKR